MGGLPLFPEQASTFAFGLDLLYFFMTALTIFFVVVIAGLITFFAIRYRRRLPDEVPEQIEGSTKLEIGWTVPLLGLAMVAFVWGAWLFIDMSSPPADALEIFVVGKQWMWKYQHVDGQQEINDLHIPVGQPIKLTMTSQDVIHSFFVPAFRAKMDVLPGRYTTMWFEATKPGVYHIFCTEYCGTNHSRMVGQVYVLEPAEYQAWLAGGRQMGSPADAGQRLFQDLGCAGCHQPDGNGPGPSLVGIYGQPQQLQNGQSVVADDTYIRESILDPMAQVLEGYEPIMPTFEGQVSEEQLIQLIAYIRSLGEQQPGAGGGQGAPGAGPVGTPSGGATTQP